MNVKVVPFRMGLQSGIMASGVVVCSTTTHFPTKVERSTLAARGVFGFTHPKESRLNKAARRPSTSLRCFMSFVADGVPLSAPQCGFLRCTAQVPLFVLRPFRTPVVIGCGRRSLGQRLRKAAVDGAWLIGPTRVRSGPAWPNTRPKGWGCPTTKGSGHVWAQPRRSNCSGG